MDDLDKYLLVLFENQDGYIYSPVRTTAGEWRQQFYRWPEEQQQLKDWIQTSGIEHDVYVCPALFGEKSARKQSVKGSQVVWVEFDGQDSIDLSGLPKPNMVVQTSSDTHVHVYWRVPFGTTQVVESINRRLTYGLEADSSGWDINQVLRPPLTRNFKRGMDVTLRGAHRNFVTHADFDKFSEPPALVSIEDISVLPDPIDVLGQYQMTKKIWQMIKQPSVEVGLRSTFLMYLGYELAEIGLKHEEIVSLLVVVDERIGKFVGRSDRLLRLAEIASIAIGKFGGATKLPIYNAQELLDLDVQIEYLWGDYLTRTGSVLLCGEPGVGKTQFAFHVAASLCIGQNFLAGKVSEPQRIIFFSLEMGDYGCKYILGHQTHNLSGEAMARLRESLLIVPQGFPMSLSTIESIVKEYEPTGIFIDTLTDTADEQLSDETQAKHMLNWDARIRAEQGIFTWWNHHTRKPSGENKTPIRIGDIYGSYLYGAKMESIMFLYGSRDNKGPIKWLRPKNRYGTTDREGTDIVRTEDLTFKLKNEGVKEIDAGKKSSGLNADGSINLDL